jgi:phosphohistidine phosphatase
MDVLVVRHGQAVDLSAEVRVDGHRWLSPKGRARTRDVAALVKSQGVALSAMRTSPYVRAVQTAEIFAQVFAFAGDLEVASVLVPGETSVTTAISSALAGLPDDATVALVGHEPLASAMCAELLGREVQGLPKSGVVCIRLGAGHRGTFLWAIDPKALALVKSLRLLSD